MFKKVKSNVFAIALMAILMILPSCSDDIFKNNQPTDIKLSSTLMEFDTIQEIQGKNLQLEASISLKGGGTTRDVIWEPPQDQSAFKVQSTAGGVLTFQIYKSGTYVISAHADYEGKHWKTAQCVITINDALTQLRIYDATHDSTFTDDSAVVELTKGDTIELAPIYTPVSTSQQNVLWSVDNSTVATISEKPNHKALLTANGKGTAKITLMSQDNTSVKRTLKVIVNDSGADQSFGLRSLTLNPTALEIPIDGSKTVTALVTGANSEEIKVDSVNFELTNTDAFQIVSQEARAITIKALKSGEAKLKANFTLDKDSVSAEIPLRVVGDVIGISASSTYINLYPYEEADITFSYLPADTLRKGFVLKTNIDPNDPVLAAKVKDDNTLTVIAKGEGVKDLEIGSIYNETATTRVTINVVKNVSTADRIRNVKLSQNTVTVNPPYEDFELEASVYRRGDNNIVEVDPKYLVDWENSDTSVLKVVPNGNTATITPLKAGSAKITVKSKDEPNVTAQCLVTVTGKLISIIPASQAIAVKKEDVKQIKLTPNPYNAIYSDPLASTSNDNVSVSLTQEEGVYVANIKGLKLGSSVVSYYVDGVKFADTTVTVFEEKPVTIRSIQLSKSNLYLKQDAVRVEGKVTAFAKDITGLTIDGKIEFESANDTSLQVASIERYDDNTFYVVPLNAGVADYYFFNEDAGTDIKSRLHIEVGGSAVQGDKIRAVKMPYDSLSIKEGEQDTITLLTIPLGLDVGTVTWISTDKAVVMVEGNGAKATLTAKSSGSAKVWATLSDGKSAELSVNVIGLNEASDTTIAKAEIIGPSNASGYKIYNLLNQAFELEAHAYHADGSEDLSEQFVWSISGEAVKAIKTDGERRSASFLTQKNTGYDKPAIVTATSVSNPNVSATFYVYVVSSTDEIPADAPILFPQYSAVTIERGNSMDISYTINPLTYDGKFNATSSDSSVSVALDQNAKKITVTGQKAGSSVVTVSDGKVSFAVKVTVVEEAKKTDPTITRLTLDRTYLSYDLADKAVQIIKATVWKGDEEDPNAQVKWTSSNEEVVKLAVSGNTVAVQPQKKTGIASVTATCTDNENVTASCFVEVMDSTQIGSVLRFVVLSESDVRLQEGAKIRLTASGKPEALFAASKQTWSSDNEDVAIVSNGTVTALKAGVANIKITVEADDKTLTDTCRVTVTAQETKTTTPSSIKLSDILMAVSQEDMDKTLHITAEVFDEYGDYMSGRLVKWDVKDPSKALEYSIEGLDFAFSPRNAGTVVVTASVGNVKAEAKIVVAEKTKIDSPLKSVSIMPNKVLMALNSSTDLTATLVPSSVKDQILWTTSSPALEITGNDRSATIKATTTGTYTVTAWSAKNPAIKATSTVEVKNAVSNEEITAVTLNVRSILLDLADKSLTSIKAIVFTNGKESNKKVTWEVPESLKGIISWKEIGTNEISIQKVGKGSGYITARSVDNNEYYGSCYVEVIDSTNDIPVLNTLMLSSSSLTLEKGSTYQFTTKTLPANVKTTTIWRSENDSIATISDTGLLETKAVGRTNIIATATDETGKFISASCSIYSYEPTTGIEPARIAFDKNIVNLSQEKMDQSVSVTATIYGVDGSVLKDGNVTWVIENETVATLNTNGNTATLSPMSAGTTTLKASYKGIENSVTVITGDSTKAAENKATGIIFNPSSLILKKGSSATITAYTVPAGTNSKVAFSVDNNDIIQASYSDNKVRLTGLKNGKAKIKATLIEDAKIFTEMEIEVVDSTENRVTAITLDKTYILMKLDTKDLTRLNATVYVDGKVSKNTPVEWSLEGITDKELSYTPLDQNKNSVSLTKKDAGKGYLVCSSKDGSISSKCLVEIVTATSEDLSLKRIQLSDSAITLRTAETYQPTVTLFPESAIAKLTWVTSDPNVARVSQNGTITGVKKGNATITVHAYDYNLNAFMDVEVVDQEAGDTVASFIRLSSQEVLLSQERPDEEVELSATVIGTDGFPIADAKVSWTIDNKRIAKMVEDENTVKLKAGDSGKTAIKAWYGNLSSTAMVYTGIKPSTDVSLDRLTVIPSVITIQTKQSGNAEVVGYPGGATVEPEWESADPEFASIDAATKNKNTVTINALKEGRATVTVTDKSTTKNQSLKVRVFDDISTVVTGIMLDKSAITFDLAEKSMARVTAQVYVANTLSQDAKVKWELLKEDLSAYKPDETPLVTFMPTDGTNRTVGIKPGKTQGRAYLRVTAEQDPEMYSQMFIEVIDSSKDPLILKEIRCEVDSATLAKGTTRQFKVVATPSNAPKDIRWSVENQNPTDAKEKNVIKVDVYGNVSALAEGTATLKAYEFGKAATIFDTVAITVTTKGTSTEDGGKPSEYDIGSITLTPANILLKQDANFPTAIKARIFDLNGKEIPSENVIWDTSKIKDIAKVNREEGNTLYLEGTNAGKGTISASRTSKNGTVIKATADITTGAIISPDQTKLTDMAFASSMPVYLVAEDKKPVTTILRYTPNNEEVKGAVWAPKNANGYITYTTTDETITAVGVQPTPVGQNAEVTAVSTSVDANGNSLSRTISYRVVTTKADLPKVTKLELDKTQINLTLAEKNTVPVTVTALDYENNVVYGANIQWSLRNNNGTNVTISNSSGVTTGVNKGTQAGMVELVAKCGDVEAVCSIRVVDTTYFGGITLSSETIRLVPGGNASIQVFGSPKDMLGDVTCTPSGDVKAVQVVADASNKNFNITGMSAGTAYLKFSTEVYGYTYTADAIVYVNDKTTTQPQLITLIPASAYIPNIGDKVELSATLWDKNGNKVNAPVTFRAEDPSIVELQKGQDNKVEVIGLKKGTTTVYVNGAELSAQSFISVGVNAEESSKLLKIIPGMDSLELKKNQKETIAISSVPANWPYKNLTVVSSRETVAEGKIVNGKLEITATGEGSAVLTISEGSVSATVNVTVKGIAYPAIIKFDKASVTLNQEKDSNEIVTPYVYDQDMNVLSTKVSLWQIDDANVINLEKLANGSVKVTPKNAGVTTVTASVDKISSSFRVAVNEKTSTATQPTAIKASSTNTTLVVGETAELEVLFEPTGLSAKAKELIWTAQDDTVTVTNLGVGKAAIKANKVGKTSVIAKSTAGVDSIKPSTVFNIIVKDVADKEVFRIKLDKNQIRLGLNSDTIINAHLYKNNEEVDASNIKWTFENNQNINAQFISGASRVDTVTGSSAAIHSQSKAGFVYVVASYGNTEAKAQIEIEDLSKADKDLSAVVISKRQMIMETGDETEFTATTSPVINGVRYTWSTEADVNDPGAVDFISANGGSVAVRATKKGNTTIKVEAQVPGKDTKVKDSVELRIENKGDIEKIYKYSQLVLNKNSVTMNPDGSYTTATATLKDASGKEIEGKLSAWAALDSRGNEIFTWTEKGYCLAGTDVIYQTIKELQEAAVIAKKVIPFSSFDVIGNDAKMIQVIPSRPGIWFIEARGPVENDKYISSRLMLNISGDVSALSFASPYLHMIIGESLPIEVSIAPESAVIKSYEWVEDLNSNGGKKFVEISDAQERTAIIKAKEIGTTKVNYSLVDANGTTRVATLTVVVHDPSYGTGGLRGVQFENVYPVATYPYSTAIYKAVATYMDGTSADDSKITYTVYNCDGTNAANNRVYTQADGKVIATFTNLDGAGVRITPLERGTFKISANLEKDKVNYTADMFLSIGGNTANVTISSNSIILYTGGSAKIDVKTDNTTNDEMYNVKLLEEYTRDGYKINLEHGTLDGLVTEGVYWNSVFSTIDAQLKGSELVIGTKALPTEGQVTQGVSLSGAKYLLTGKGDSTINQDQRNKLLDTFPRTAKFLIENSKGVGSTTLNVTVNQLPTGNTYPIDISLGNSKMDLNPPFTTEQTIEVSLKDINGAETRGTINWYYYAMGQDPDINSNLLSTKTENDKADVYAYFSSDTKTMYFKPKMSGLYRLTAESIQNPQLRYTTTLNVGGGVTGVVADVGSALSVEKSKSSTITAQFTPIGALARQPWFAVDTGKGIYKIITDTVFKNDYIDVTVNNGTDTGASATVFGKLVTGNEHRQIIRIIYPQTTQGESTLRNKYLSGDHVFKVKGTQMEVYELNKDNGQPMPKSVETIDVFSYATTVDVFASKTVYSFKVDGMTEVDPNSIEGSVLTYKAGSNSSSTESAFKNWDWVEAKVVGTDSNMVYSASVPVDANGHTLYLNEKARTVNVINADGSKGQLPMSAGLYYPDPAFCTSTTKGVPQSKLINYNSMKTIERFFKGTSHNINDADKLPAKIAGNAEYTQFWVKGGGMISDPAFEVFTDENGKYYIQNGVRQEVNANDGLLALVDVPAPLSALENGKLLTSDNNQTYQLQINNRGIPLEPLMFKVGISEYIENNNNDSAFYDEETEAFKTSDTTLFVGGKLQSLRPGKIEYYNNGNTVNNGNEGSGSLLLIEGASAIISLAYNPSFTHQKQVEWAVVGGKLETNEYSAIPSKDSTQITFLAKKLENGDKKTVHLRATSVTNPDITCDFTVVINCVVKNISFVSSVLTQVNKGVTTAVPEYKLINKRELYPDQMTDNKIDCYDYTDAMGESGIIDAYQIKMKPTPDFGYDFTAQIVQGGEIGNLDTANMDASSNMFRFVPKGRVYNKYDENGRGILSEGYDVSYGNVTVRVACQELNYSKDFTISYSAAAGRLVRAIDNPHSNWKDCWDYMKIDDRYHLIGLEAIVLYEGESFPVSMVDFNNGVTVGQQRAFRYYTDADWDPYMKWSLEDGNGYICYTTDDNPKDSKFYGLYVNPEEKNSIVVDDLDKHKYVGGLTFTVDATPGHDDDPRCRDGVSDEDKELYRQEGVYGEVCTLYAKRQGIYKIRYTLFDAVKDSEGNVLIGEDGFPSYAITNGSIPVYVISKANQPMLAAINTTVGSAVQGAWTPNIIKEFISKSQIDKWYLPSKDTGSNSGTATPMYRGRTFFAFDNTITYGSKTYLGLSDTEVYNTYNKGLDGNEYPFLDFSQITLTNFKEAFNNSALYNSSDISIGGYSTKGVKIERAFKGINFEDLKLTGPYGLALLKVTKNFKIAPGEGINPDQTDDWVKNNIEYDETLKSSLLYLNMESSERIHIDNMNLSAADAIMLREDTEASIAGKHLVDFSLTNSTFISGTIYSGKIDWAADKAKNLEYVKISDCTMSKLKLVNFNSLSQNEKAPGLTLGNIDARDISAGAGNFARSNVTLNKIGNNALNICISFKVTGPLLVKKLDVKDCYLDNLKFGADDEFKDLLSDIAIDNVIVNGAVVVKGKQINTFKVSELTANSFMTNTMGLDEDGNSYTFAEGFPKLTISGFDNLQSIVVGDSGVTSRGFKEIDIRGTGKKTVSSIVLKGNDETITDKITISNVVILPPKTVANTKGINISDFKWLNSLVVKDVRNIQTLKISNCIDNNISNSKWSILGCGEPEKRMSLEANTSNIKELIIGGTVDNKLSYIDLDKTKYPNNIKTLNLDGVDCENYELPDDVSSFILGDEKGTYRSDIRTFKISNNSKIQYITFMGSTERTTIGTLDMKDFKNLSLASFVAKNVNPNDTGNVKRTDLAVNKVNLKNAYVRNKEVFRNIITVLGTDGVLDATGINIYDPTIKDGGTFTLGASGTIIVKGETYITPEPKHSFRAYLEEYVAYAPDSDSFTLAKAEKEAKAVHSYHCFDIYEQNHFDGGEFKDCTRDCKNFKDKKDESITLHYHAPANGGAIFQMASTKNDGFGINKKETGVMTSIESRDARKVNYMADKKITTTTGNIENGGESQEVSFFHYNWHCPVTITHLGSEYNKFHDETNPNDGCVIKVTYANGDNEIYQTYGWDTRQYKLIPIGNLSIDPTHNQEEYPDNNKDIALKLVFDDDTSLFVRRSFVCNVENHQDVDKNSTITQWMVENGLGDFVTYKSMFIVLEETQTFDPVKVETETKVAATANDRVHTIILNEMKVKNGGSKELENLTFNLSLLNLKNFTGSEIKTFSKVQVNAKSLKTFTYTGSTNLTDIEFTPECKALTTVDLHNNSIGKGSLKVGDFEYRKGSFPKGGDWKQGNNLNELIAYKNDICVYKEDKDRGGSSVSFTARMGSRIPQNTNLSCHSIAYEGHTGGGPSYSGGIEKYQKPLDGKNYKGGKWCDSGLSSSWCSWHYTTATEDNYLAGQVVNFYTTQGSGYWANGVKMYAYPFGN